MTKPARTNHGPGTTPPCRSWVGVLVRDSVFYFLWSASKTWFEFHACTDQSLRQRGRLPWHDGTGLATVATSWSLVVLHPAGKLLVEGTEREDPTTALEFPWPVTRAYSGLVTTTWMLLSRARLQKTMMGIPLLMFVVATMHVAVNFTRIIKAFIIFAGAIGGPAAFFNQLAEFTQMFGSNTLCHSDSGGRCLYRCYLVWERRLWVIAFPFALLLGSTASHLSLYTRYVVVDAVSPIVGIVFSVIILRIALGVSTEDGETALFGAEDIRMSRMPSTGSNRKVHTFDHEVV
ncbi:hypothetical protein GGX14DRAFT_645842 [Mycena pura]|uniref:Uncharacterized protein n=1 Tax=Mycena pura TaxID=153505 RepID=A0AAD6YDX6_9AGAR|nr:hypothetical protein GGX14DRAFT_645842 [Mycena pura]